MLRMDMMEHRNRLIRGLLLLASGAIFACSNPGDSLDFKPPADAGFSSSSVGSDAPPSGGDNSSPDNSSSSSAGSSSGGMDENPTAPIEAGESSSSSSAGASSSGGAEPSDSMNSNAFGIDQIFTGVDDVVWDSSHWAAGESRLLVGRDTTDPTGWSQARGSGDPVLQVLGDGRLQMSGGEPRFYINTYPDNSADRNAAQHLFTNVEFTGYFRRLSTSGADYGGFVVGVRSGPLGHGSSDGDDCDATTYYSRIRNDGRWQFQKELKHPDSAVVQTTYVWPNEEPFPLDIWVGMKFVVYTLAGGGVQLQAWVDMTEGENGGDWQLLGEYIDDGNWNAEADWGEATAEGCDYDADYVIAPGNGVVLIRNTDGSGEYKWITVREISPP